MASTLDEKDVNVDGSSNEDSKEGRISQCPMHAKETKSLSHAMEDDARIAERKKVVIGKTFKKYT